MENNYNYLFPYEKIPMGSDILIYGAGTLGQNYLQQMQITRYCQVLGFVDKNYDQYPPMVIPVYAPNRISTLQFDYIVIALRMSAAFHEIMRILHEQGVDEKQVVAVFERKYTGKIFADDLNLPMALQEDKKEGIYFAILATGGFGDMVIQKRLVMEFIRLVPDCRIDIYNIKSISLLKYLYQGCINIHAVIPDLGARYLQNVSKYALGITIEACHFLKVDHLQEEKFPDKYHFFVEQIKRLERECEDERADISMPPHVTIYRRMIQGCNVYTGFNYHGTFAINDHKVDIPLDEHAGKYVQSLGLNNYITFNYGNGDCMDSSKVAKAWPRHYFEQLISLLKAHYPSLKIIQIGAEGAEKIRGCDMWRLGDEFTIVEHLLKHAIFHLDIEGGLVHLATQLETKCIVLFGPTVKEYYGYDENINIQVGTCHNCWGLYPDVNRCVRGMKEPECMYSIKPELVMEYIQHYLTEQGFSCLGKIQEAE